ncbi:MAG: hypothetical protein ACI8XB_002040 [Patiriisocius sp.]|jgi:hypothetical protein
MNYRIKKGSYKMLVFMLTGGFLIVMSCYELYNYLQTHQFVTEFPGDWDKPIGIAVGLFLIIRSKQFVLESRNLFIKISGDQLVYRTRNSDSVRKIDLSDIEKLLEKNEKIILVTKDSTKLIIIDFNTVRLRNDTKSSIKKSLFELND